MKADFHGGDVGERMAMRKLRRIARRLWINVITHIWPLCRLWYRRFGVELEGRPDDDVWYFAYGANMHDSAFQQRRGMCPKEWRPGLIKGFRLRFNLDGHPKGLAAPANISAEHGAEVWGVLYRIGRRDLIRLDSTEGVPGRRYRHLWADAEDGDGVPLTAVTYIANGNEEDGKPSHRYITLLRDGARHHGLPDAWLDYLESVEPAAPTTNQQTN